MTRLWMPFLLFNCGSNVALSKALTHWKGNVWPIDKNKINLNATTKKSLRFMCKKQREFCIQDSKLKEVSSCAI